MNEKEVVRQRNRTAVGAGLIILGILLVVGQLTNINWLSYSVLPFLGLGFFAWGISTRQAGLMIPGGIFVGIGLGTLLMGGPFAETEAGAGIFMFGFAAGWVLITVATAIFTEETQWWALIPAAVMAVVGAGFIYGDSVWNALALIGRYWPLTLVLLGLYIILKRRPLGT